MPARVHPLFTRFATATSRATGKSLAFILAVGAIVAWLATGPLLHFSESWQLVINTGTTIVTFLMVFLIQNTQNRDSAAVQIKLDELLRVTSGAHNTLLDLEDLEAQELEQIRVHYEKPAERAREALRRGAQDTDVPEVD